MPVWAYPGDAAAVDAVEVALSYLKAVAPVAPNVVVTSSYTTKHNGVAHVYLRQEIAGLAVANAVGNVNVRAGKVLSAYTRFYTGSVDVPEADLVRPTLSAVVAARKLAHYLHIPHLTHVSGTARWPPLFSPRPGADGGWCAHAAAVWVQGAASAQRRSEATALSSRRQACPWMTSPPS